MKKDKKTIPDEPRPTLPDHIKKLNGKSGERVKSSIEKLMETIKIKNKTKDK